LLGKPVAVDLKALIQSMETLSRNPALRQNMGQAARQRVLDVYDWPVIVRQYEELWDELLKEASRYEPIPSETDFRHGVCSYDT
jgi:glycosyltransferase involved in cell wall biosynthesis